jgi:hypothetical protein
MIRNASKNVGDIFQMYNPCIETLFILVDIILKSV